MSCVYVLLKNEIRKFYVVRSHATMAKKFTKKRAARAKLLFCLSNPIANSQEKLKTMLMQNFGVTNKEHYGMLWYFLEWSIAFCRSRCRRRRRYTLGSFSNDAGDDNDNVKKAIGLDCQNNNSARASRLRDEISALKFEGARLHFLSDVFVAVAVVSCLSSLKSLLTVS